jgi:hypothetical protein
MIFRILYALLSIQIKPPTKEKHEKDVELTNLARVG